jgi:hypothetical protein
MTAPFPDTNGAPALPQRRHLLAISGAALLLAACVPQGDIATTRIDQRTDRSPMGMGLDNRDFTEAAGELVRDMLDSGRLQRPGGGAYALGISRIRNDTQLRINTDELVRKIRIDLSNAGVTRTIVGTGLNGPEDPLVGAIREGRRSGEVNQRSVPARGQLEVAGLSLSGIIVQRNNRVDGGAMRIDYTFSLAVADARTGVAIWEGERVISRLGSGRTVTW